jgi:hypothetical protein
VGPRSAALSDVACRSDASCVAVGVYDSTTGAHPLVETLVGSSWITRGLPSPRGASYAALQFVTCPTATTCVAGGTAIERGSGAHLLFATRTGAAWSETVLPNPAGLRDPLLFGLSCGSPTTCIAVGYGLGPHFSERVVTDMLERGRWKAVVIPRPKGAKGVGIVTSVSCVDRARCVAVGVTDAGSYVATLTGSRWAAVALRSPMRGGQLDLTNVSCRTAASCLAVGTVDRGNASGVFAATLRGVTWSYRQMTPMSTRLYDEPTASSCGSASSCTIDVQQISNLLDFADLLAGPAYVDRVVMLRGSASSEATVATPLGAQGMQLQGIACPSPTRCIEVGGDSYPNGDNLPVVAIGR